METWQLSSSFSESWLLIWIIWSHEWTSKSPGLPSWPEYVYVCVCVYIRIYLCVHTHTHLYSPAPTFWLNRLCACHFHISDNPQHALCIYLHSNQSLCCEFRVVCAGTTQAGLDCWPTLAVIGNNWECSQRGGCTLFGPKEHVSTAKGMAGSSVGRSARNQTNSSASQFNSRG